MPLSNAERQKRYRQRLRDSGEPESRPVPRRGERAKAIQHLLLTSPNLSNGQIAEVVGCTRSNVRQQRSNLLSTFFPSVSDSQLDDFRNNKTSILEAVQMGMLISCTPEKIAKSSALQLVTGAAILQDKIQLLSGQPTSIHLTALLDVAAMMRKREG